MFKISSQYICELTLQDADPYLKYQPSTIAASAVVLALHILELPSWVSFLSQFALHCLELYGMTNNTTYSIYSWLIYLSNIGKKTLFLMNEGRVR